MDNPNFWDFLAKQNQEDFRNSRTAGSCIEARELIIALPEEFQKYDREQLLKLFVMKFKLEYGADVVAAARRRCERAQGFSAEASKPVNIFKRNMKTKAARELSASLLEYEKAISEPDKIVKRAGYKNVAAFTRAYEKSCKLLESMKRTEPQKESIIASLKKYEKEALIRKGDFSRGAEEQTHIKTKENVR